jgi:hypothetical protein
MPRGVYERKTNPIANLGTRPKQTLEERFWAKVDKSGECWLWTAAVDGRGYGKIQTGTLAKPKLEAAHRVAWRLTRGTEPTGFVLHHCDTPRCVRPDHLFEGTSADNAADMVTKGRQTRGASHPFARLTEEQVREIRSLDPEITNIAAVARRYGVSYFTIRKVVRGETWRDV